MYKIEKHDYGFKIIFSGTINANEMARWVEDSKKNLLSTPPKFGVLVDMRQLNPLENDAKEQLEIGQKLYKQKGMVRSAVILSSAVIALQFKRIAQETGIYQWERYINAISNPNWEQIAIDWITKGIDPDK